MQGYKDGRVTPRSRTADSGSSRDVDGQLLGEDDSLFAISDFESDDEGGDYPFIMSAYDEYFEDENGRLFDADGYFVDEYGRYVDDHGDYIDEYGNAVDVGGYYVDKEPHHVAEAQQRLSSEVINETNREVKMKNGNQKMPRKLQTAIKKEAKAFAERREHPSLSEELKADIQKAGQASVEKNLQQVYQSIRAQFIQMKDTIDGLQGAYTERKKTDFAETSTANRFLLWKSENPNPARVKEIEAVQTVASKYALGKPLAEGCGEKALNTEIQRLSEAFSAMKDAAQGLLKKVENEYFARSATNSSLYSVLKESLTYVPEMTDIKEAKGGMSYTLNFK